MFNELGINEKITKILVENGITNPTEIQQKTIPLIIDGKDVVGKSRTGSGKTLAYALPIIQNIKPEDPSIQALIVAPTRELALQITEEIRKITSFFEGIKTTPVFGGINMDRQIKSLKQGANIVVGTPGRIIDHLKRKTLKLHNIKTVVLDEADEMLSMGFREDIEEILKTTHKIRQTIMFSATMPKNIIDITNNYMNNPILVEAGEGEYIIDKIAQRYVFCKDKSIYLVDMLAKTKPKQCIIFCNTKKMVDNLVKLLLSNSINALGIHGDKRQSERSKIMTEVKKIFNNIILIATDVAARGIDIKNVDYVINYDIPQSMEYYVHRVGRTARAGKSGIAITLVNTRNQLAQIRELENYIGAKLEEIPNKDGLKLEKKSFNSTNKSYKNKDDKKFNPKRFSSEGKHNYIKETEKTFKYEKQPEYSDKNSFNTKTKFNQKKNAKKEDLTKSVVNKKHIDRFKKTSNRTFGTKTNNQNKKISKK